MTFQELGSTQHRTFFSDFAYLKQQFTQGERWGVEHARIDRLLEQGLIGREQAKDFQKNGAIGRTWRTWGATTGSRALIRRA